MISLRGLLGRAPEVRACPVVHDAGAAAPHSEVRRSLAQLFGPFALELRDATRALNELDPAAIALPGALEVKLHRPYHATLGPSMRQLERKVVATGVHRTTMVPGTHVAHDVGDHGLPLAVALARAGVAMQHVVATRLADHAAEVTASASTRNFDGLLQRWTAQQDLEQTLHEGIATYAHTAATLTSARLPGLDADGILAALADGEAFEQATGAPFSFWAQMRNHGIVPVRPLVLDAEGNARLSPEVLGAMRQQTPATPIHGATGLRCPMSGKQRVDVAGGGTETFAPIRDIGRAYIELSRRMLASADQLEHHVSPSGEPRRSSARAAARKRLAPRSGR